MKRQMAFLFPGQGSQSAGMLDEHMHEAVVADTFAEAADVLGYDVAALVRDNPEGRLDATEYTQPALLTSSIALLRLWRDRLGAEAAHAAGHSLGEYSALVAVGSLAFADAVRLVAFRGHAMSKAVAPGEGLMAAVLGLDDALVEDLCAEACGSDGKVWPANYNCPGQVVVAGHHAAVERLLEKARRSGARRTVPLAVSTPSHTPLMRPAAMAMRTRLAEITLAEADRPVWSNAWAQAITHAADIREALVEQLTSPVRWTQTIIAMRRQGVNVAVEMGPGRVLTGLVRRIDRELPVHATETPALLKSSLLACGGGEDE